MSEPAILDRLAIVMAHPDDEVLWACSVLRAAEKVVLVFGELRESPPLTEGRKAAMAAFPLPTLEWLEMVEASVFGSASWPNARETEYGLYPHRALKALTHFDPERYRRQYGELRDRLRVSLRGMKNVITHSPWGEYGHEDHSQVFRAVASLAGEMGFQVWVPGYYAPMSETLMRRNLVYLGRPTEPLPIDHALAEEIAQIYKRTGSWTWFDSYQWPDTERFFPWYAGGPDAGAGARAEEILQIRFPAGGGPAQPYWKRQALRVKRRLSRLPRDVVRRGLSWWNGRMAR
ncbi:MAG TPA: hypothetical protein VK146_12115 [Tabrizicola sp.]|nr:hypothetical protein [Tabrizicola sp.]